MIGKTGKSLLVIFLYFGLVLAQVNTESMRKEDAEERFANTLGF